MFADLAFDIALLLLAAAFLAGFVDSIAGGGGLITVPALLLAGFSPVEALGTNKLQGLFGAGSATIAYASKGHVDLKRQLPSAALSFLGAAAGAALATVLPGELLRAALPAMLIAIALYFAVAPRLGDADSRARLRFPIWVPVMGFCIGFYDGLFGPGTGSFLTMGFVTLFGLGLTRATGHTKVLNLMSNLGALVVFVLAGDVVWPAAIAMAIGQLAGGYIGARTGIRFGARLIRPLIIIVSVILALRLLLFP